MKRICVDSPVSLDEFAEHGSLLALSYQMVIKSSTAYKIPKTG
jgi:hypothetical protein